MKHRFVRPIALLLVGLAVIAPSLAHAQGVIGEFIDSVTGITPAETQGSYAQKKIKQVQTNYENKAIDIAERKLAASTPLGPIWEMGISGYMKDISSQAKIPLTNKTLPSTLWDANFSTSMKYKVFNQSGAGVYAKGGWATDEPFKAVDTMYYDATVYFSAGVEPRTTMVIYANISNRRPLLLNLPIPGFSYGLRLSPYWGITLGFPYFGLWVEPADWVKLTVSAEPLFQFDGRLTFIPSSFYQLYFNGVSKQEVFFRSERSYWNEYLFFDNLEFNIGLVQDYKILALEIAGGWAFTRRITETKDYWNQRKSGYLEMAQGWLAQVSAKIKF